MPRYNVFVKKRKVTTIDANSIKGARKALRIVYGTQPVKSVSLRKQKTKKR